MLNDFIAKQDINVIARTEIYEDKVIFPTDIDPVEFNKEFNEEINSNEFTTEKALYVASKHKRERYISSRDLLYLKTITNN